MPEELTRRCVVVGIELYEAVSALWSPQDSSVQ